MKLKFVSILFSAFFSVSIACASPWSELEAGSVVRLKNDLRLTETLVLPKDSTLAINQIEAFGPPYLEFITLRLFPCTAALANQRLDMILLDDQYGFELDLNCKISVYLEIKDHYRESYFERTQP